MVSSFSLYYKSLFVEQKNSFNKAFAQKIVPFENEIKCDEDLCDLPFEEFISSLGTSVNTSTFVEVIYAKITSGVQVGSGNQNLFLGILNACVEAWAETIKK